MLDRIFDQETPLSVDANTPPSRPTKRVESREKSILAGGSGKVTDVQLVPLLVEEKRPLCCPDASSIVVKRIVPRTAKLITVPVSRVLCVH
jgi:hypothetical protein